MSVENQNSPVSVKIGILTAYTHIVAYDEEVQACDGGDMQEPRTVAGSYTFEGFTDKPKKTVFLITIDNANVRSDLEGAGYFNRAGENGGVPSIEVVERNSELKTRKITFTASGRSCCIDSIKNKKVHGVENPTCEVKITFKGTVNITNWA
jgi:hypothetical protein